MIDVVTGSAIAAVSVAVWTFGVCKLARLRMVPRFEHEKLFDLYNTQRDLASKAEIQLSQTRQTLEQRERRLQMLSENIRMIEVRFNESISQQNEQASVIQTLKEDNDVLRQEVEALKNPPKRRVRSGK